MTGQISAAASTSAAGTVSDSKAGRQPGRNWRAACGPQINQGDSSVEPGLSRATEELSQGQPGPAGPTELLSRASKPTTGGPPGGAEPGHSSYARATEARGAADLFSPGGGHSHDGGLAGGCWIYAEQMHITGHSNGGQQAQAVIESAGQGFHQQCHISVCAFTATGPAQTSI